MRIEFLDSTQEMSQSGGPRGIGGKVSKKDGGLFWWTMLITLLLGVATFSWFFSIYVFTHPERPFNYRLLSQLDRVEEIKKFDRYNIPKGDSYSAKEMYSGNYQYKSSHLKVKNSLLKRAYLTNYANDKPTYIKGKFQVLQFRKLSESDPIAFGYVIRARSVDYPTLTLEYLLPTKEAAQSNALPYRIGDSFEINSRRTYASVLHLEKEQDEQLCVTAISLVYPELAATGESSSNAKTPSIQLSAPARMNLEGAWPVTDSGLIGRGKSESPNGKIIKAIPLVQKS